MGDDRVAVFDHSRPIYVGYCSSVTRKMMSLVH